MNISMKNGQNKKCVNFTESDMVISKNLKSLMKEKNISVKELAEKAEVSRQAIYNIVNGTSIPRDDTLALIAKQLGVTLMLLKNGNEQYDYDFFMEQLRKKFPYHMETKQFKTDVEDYLTLTDQEFDENYDSEGIERRIDLGDFLIFKFGINPYDMFYKCIVPSDDIQQQIANYFGYEVNELFKCIGKFPVGIEPLNTRHIDVFGKEKFDHKTFEVVFKALNKKNKKTILNLCMDLLKIQSN